MRGDFRTGDFDGGIKTGVNLVLDNYRSHEAALGGGTRAPAVTVPQGIPTTTKSSFGGFGMLWLILILLVGFLVIRAIFRAISGPRPIPPGYGGPGYGGPGYGGPGYGYGGGGGGGGFFSGLLGGLGGAWLGNELFGHNRGGDIGANSADIAGTQSFQAPDQAGWQSDAGQADTSNSSFGDWGSGGDGGGFDAGGGFDGGGGGDGGGGW
jgi:hypothetical protein